MEKTNCRLGLPTYLPTYLPIRGYFGKGKRRYFLGRGSFW